MDLPDLGNVKAIYFTPFDGLVGFLVTYTRDVTEVINYIIFQSVRMLYRSYFSNSVLIRKWTPFVHFYMVELLKEWCYVKANRCLRLYYID